MTGSNLGQHLSQKLGQRLALTPQLTQSLKVLAMSSMELEAYIDECLESNPLLEIDPNIQQRDLAAEKNQPEATSSTADTDWKQEGDDRWESMYANTRREGEDSVEQQWTNEQSLGESLHEQINQQPMQDIERVLGHALIDSLDDDGYFRSDPQELADALDVSAEQVTQCLERIVHELEPAGIGARDLTECLLLQLVGVDVATRVSRRLLLHFTEYLTEDDEKLAEKAGCSIDDIVLARQRMSHLDPFPGHGLREEPNIYVRPEIIFRSLNNGDIEVEIPQSGWRGIRMSEQWKEHTWKGPDREFMSHASQEAKWLMYALDQRSETLKKVGLYLAKCQRNFLYHGILGLKPLTLQDVAEQVGLHESTISRVTHGKYAQTPLGLIELRRFFSSGLPTRGGGMISVYRVQQRLKTLIQFEPIGKPISDQAIADRLVSEGIEIARRTVAKYREQLGLPPSSQRRRASQARKSQVRR
ncbi:MAG: RNA polymerase factor sigma-54 [Mariprofundaceae bacterium]|nr:RNA polymerase factor sigma-54 [Mariprofundaceae bacterium]